MKKPKIQEPEKPVEEKLDIQNQSQESGNGDTSMEKDRHSEQRPSGSDDDKIDDGSGSTARVGEEG